MNKPGLDPLLERPDVWRGPRLSRAQPALPSGHAALDALLPGGGWPLGALTEVCCAQPGMGEIGLLLPALAQLRESSRWLGWVAPPHPLYAPALAGAGIDIERCLVVEPPQPGLRHAPARAQQALWAAEQLLRGGACGAVLLWWDGEDANALRRLQLAAESGQALAVLFRPEAAASRLSPAALRLRIDADGSFEIVKCRGGDWRAERGQRLRLKRGQSTFSPQNDIGHRPLPPAAKMYSDPGFLPLRILPSPAAAPVQPGLAIDAGAAAPADWRAMARRERQRRS
jgi:cell division inhibitor SulA